ncbi:MAG: galactose-1-phosphate uridylyltransferase [bacterium]
MPELRKNIATNEWVILAIERAKRPEEFSKKENFAAHMPAHRDDCPLCSGNEHMTPPDIYQIGKPWSIRVVPNKYPALSGGQTPKLFSDGVIQTMNGVGNHEVIIEIPKHNISIPMMDNSQIENLIKTYYARYTGLKSLPYIKHVIIFKNYGPEAGTSLEHSHSQVIAMPIVPHPVESRLAYALKYFEKENECVFCRMIKDELKLKDRIVVESDNFVALIPYAANSPFHTWLMPKRHMSEFDEINEKEIKDLARVLKDYLYRICQGLGNPSYNLVIRSSPCGEGSSKSFHWYMAFVFRLTQMAGFEMGSGMFINTSLPDNDAEYLRDFSI